jgi:hypothetical protein
MWLMGWRGRKPVEAESLLAEIMDKLEGMIEVGHELLSAHHEP